MAGLITTSFTSGATLTAAEVEKNFNRLHAMLKGQIPATSFAAASNVKIDSLANQYQVLYIPMVVYPSVYAGWTAHARKPIVSVPLPFWDGVTLYIDGITMGISDWGTQTTQFRLDYGYFERSSASTSSIWTTLQNIIPLTTLGDVSGGAFGDNTGDTRLLTPACNSIMATSKYDITDNITQCPMLALFVEVKDAAMLTGGTAPDFWSFGITLKVRLQPEAA